MSKVIPKSYYNKLFFRTLSFIIPQNKKALLLGSLNGDLLASLSPSEGVGVESEPDLYNVAKKKYRKLKFVRKSNYKYETREKFDYIILLGTLGQTNDIQGLLESLHSACEARTRLIVYQHNHFWQFALTLAEHIGLKRKESIQNWLSISDVSVYLKAAGYEVTRIFKRTLSPAYFFGLGPLINFVATLIPLFDFLKLDQFLIARPDPALFASDLPKSLSICITVKNEKANIEPIVKLLPILTRTQEIIFIEGGSTDGTIAEIKRTMKEYPSKNIRLIRQRDYGQSGAIKIGFRSAKGDIIILYEGDGTSNPLDLKYFYNALASGRFEFIEGSRFVYPVSSKTMPPLNKLGNMFFAKWFSFFLGQRTTDVLSGIKGMLKRDFDLLYKHWGFLGANDPFGDFELLFGSARMGLKFGEIPMRYYPRTYGESKTKFFKHGLYLLKMAARGYWVFRRN